MSQLSVSLWKHGSDNEHLGTWYSEEGVQVPRKGDILWLETDENRHDRWKVVNVQWSFRNSKLGNSQFRMLGAEIWIKPAPALWKRFAMLFPRTA